MLSLTFIVNLLYFSFIAYGLVGLSRDFRYRESMNKLEFEKSQNAASDYNRSGPPVAMTLEPGETRVRNDLWK